MRLATICAVAVFVAATVLALGCQPSRSPASTTPPPQTSRAQPPMPPPTSPSTLPMKAAGAQPPAAATKPTAAPAAEPGKEHAMPDEEISKLENTVILIRTARGDIICKLFDDAAPQTCKRMTKLMGDGFFTGLVFHRVEDWVIQGGEGHPPVTQTIPDEPNSNEHVIGALGMAKTNRPNSATTQFYLLKKAAPWLDQAGTYTVWGQTLAGQEVTDAIQVGDKIEKMVVLKERGVGKPVKWPT